MSIEEQGEIQNVGVYDFYEFIQKREVSVPLAAGVLAHLNKVVHEENADFILPKTRDDFITPILRDEVVVALNDKSVVGSVHLQSYKTTILPNNAISQVRKDVNRDELIADPFAYIEVSSFMVHPDYNGQGVGARLLDSIMPNVASYVSRGVDVFAVCNVKNIGAVRLFERYGFNQTIWRPYLPHLLQGEKVLLQYTMS